MIYHICSKSVVAAGSAASLAICTGMDTHAMMHTSAPQAPIGLLDLEMNRLAKAISPINTYMDPCAVIRSFFRPRCS